jgi:hypothetical protein
MDPVSALGVAAAAAQFAGLALSVSNKLVQFISSVKEAPKKSRELISEISIVSHTLEDLKSTLEATQSTDGSLTNATFKGFADLLNEMTARIEVKENDIQKRLKWPFTEKQNKEYLERVERYKNTFNFALNSLQMYLLIFFKNLE